MAASGDRNTGERLNDVEGSTRSCRESRSDGWGVPPNRRTLREAIPLRRRRCESGRMTRRHLARIDVEGRPATFATAGEKPWKDAVRRAVAGSGCAATSGRFAVELEFRLGEARRVSEVWDLDNLIKPTLDAMEGVFGLRPWGGTPQPADDQVDEIRAVKRQPLPGEHPGARIDVWLIEVDDPAS